MSMYLAECVGEGVVPRRALTPDHLTAMRYLTDPQTGNDIQCERCDLYPAVAEVDYTDANGDDACDAVCSSCKATA